MRKLSVITVTMLVMLTLTVVTVGMQQVHAKVDNTVTSSDANQVKASIITASLSPTKAQQQAALNAYGKLPLYFVENQGQLDRKVVFYVNQPEYSLYFTNQALYLRLIQKGDGESKAHGLRIELINADPDGVIESIKRASGIVSIFKGKKEEWRTNIQTSNEIAYTRPWPGVSLHYKGHQGKLESIYHVASGADSSLIRMRYSGQERLSLDEQGNLVIKTSLGEVIESAPFIYQEIKGKRVPIEGGFSLKDDTVGFRIGAYDREYPLIIDPVLDYAGYIGGSDYDHGRGIAVDSSGNAYITGSTESDEASFPVTVGPHTSYNGGSDAFVAKVKADGTGLVYAGYIGGSDLDHGWGIAVDSSGNAYITGPTYSTESHPTPFPVTVGPDLTHNGGRDIFVAKVNPSGTGLVYAGYIGGSDLDHGWGIAIDSSGNAYITGLTESDETSFPVKVGPDLTHNGGTDIFVAKVNPSGTELVYAGYIGGPNWDEGDGIAVDSSGNAYITGYTSSDQSTFPVKGGPDLTYNGSTDAFVAKVNPSGTELVYAGYIGGSHLEWGSGIAVDSSGNAYITGGTFSTESDPTPFPVTVGPDLTYNGGVVDAFVAKVNPSGTGLVYAGYIGGSDLEWGWGIAVDSSGNAYITGGTESDETSFPVKEGPDTTSNGWWDAFVAKVNPSGTELVYAGYIGGSSGDEGYGIAVDSSSNAYITGPTYSTESDPTPFPVTVGPDLTHNGGRDVFVAKVKTTVTVYVDIRPGSCPNPLYLGAKGVLPVAVLGTEDFDVATIDSASIELEGISPIRSSLKDVSTPVMDRQDVCDCTVEEADGYTDLTLKFDIQEIVDSIGDVEDGDVLILTLTGRLLEEYDGTQFEGQDCVWILKKGR